MDEIATFLAAGPALGLDSLKILVPAAPGGGWDQTGRALQAALQSEKIVQRITVDNKGGAGGTIGIAQFVSSNKGDPNAVMIGCMVESQLAVAPAAHISSLADWVDLDGHLLLAEQPFTGLELRDGRVLPSDGPGLGLKPA